jgi:hypothetical protein
MNGFRQRAAKDAAPIADAMTDVIDSRFKSVLNRNTPHTQENQNCVEMRQPVQGRISTGSRFQGFQFGMLVASFRAQPNGAVSAVTLNARTTRSNRKETCDEPV